MITSTYAYEYCLLTYVEIYPEPELIRCPWPPMILISARLRGTRNPTKMLAYSVHRLFLRFSSTPPVTSHYSWLVSRHPRVKRSPNVVLRLLPTCLSRLYPCANGNATPTATCTHYPAVISTYLDLTIYVGTYLHIVMCKFVDE